MNRADASEQIAAAIRHRINGLAPGDRLGSETSLADEFAVSRPTVREALRLLASTHRIKVLQGRNGGVFVASTENEGMAMSMSASIAAMLETHDVSLGTLLETRFIIEPKLAGLAAENARSNEVQLMYEHIEIAQGHSPLSEQFLQADNELHLAIAQASGNKLLMAFSAWFRDVLQSNLVDFTSDVVDGPAILEQHQAIVDAIQRRDSESAERAMEEHIEYFRKLVREVSSPASQ